MADVDTNNFAAAVARESSLGVPTTSWLQLEINGEPDFGAELTKITRNPIRKNRNAEKGVVTDIDATVKLDMDVTGDALREFGEATFMAAANGPIQHTGNNLLAPTAVTSTGYTVPSGGALPQRTLVVARGFAIEGNNGLKVVGASSTGTEIKAAGLAAETVAATVNASVEVCGFRGADDDIIMTVSSGVATLGSTVVDFTTFGLTPGQWVRLDGFTDDGNNAYGRVRTVAAHAIAFDRGTFVTDTGTNIDVLFGPFLRNVAVDDADWLKRSYHIEGAYENLGEAGADAFEYAEGNYITMLEADYPLTSKATMSLSFVGQDIPPPTETRLSGASTPRLPQQKLLYNTSEDVADIRLAFHDETEVTASFKSFKISMNNNLSGERKLGRMGAAKINVGRLDVGVDISAWFDSPAALLAARASETLQFWAALRNADGGHVWDVPSGSLDGPGKAFPENATVLQNLKLVAHQDRVLGYSVSLSRFPYLPPAE